MKIKNEFLLGVARDNLEYAREYKRHIKDNLYEIRQSYNYVVGLYKRAIWRNPKLIYER